MRFVLEPTAGSAPPFPPGEGDPGGEVCVYLFLPRDGADVNGFGSCFKLIAEC